MNNDFTLHPLFLDRNGMVLPQPKSEDHAKPADNCLMYSCIADILGFKLEKPLSYYIEACMIKPGLLGRWPGNDYDQAAWDDYMTVAVWSLVRKETKYARQILSYGVRNAFFFDTDGKPQEKDFLLRHVMIWPLMFAAAFPKLSFLTWAPLWFCQLFIGKPDLKNTSGIQLDWLFFVGSSYAGMRFTKAFEVQKVIKEAFAIYYHKEHPFNKTNEIPQGEK